MRSRILNALSALVIVFSVCVIGGESLAAWRPLRDSGATLSLSGASARTAPSAADTSWDGSFSTFLLCGIDKTNLLTDVILLVSFDNSTGKIHLLQIPRDTYAGSDIPSEKYNAVYGHPPAGISGMEALRAHVQRDFGIRIDHYAAITTKGFDAAVNAVGGIDLNVPVNMNYDDPAQDLHIHLKKGWQHLDGSEAEQFVRCRKCWPTGDLGRLQAQKAFLAAFAEKLRAQGAAALAVKVLPALTKPDFLTDMSLGQMVSYGLAARKLSLSNVSVATAPGEDYTDPKTHASLYTIHKDELLTVLNDGFLPAHQRLTADNLGITELAHTVDSSPYTNSGNLAALVSAAASSGSSRSASVSSGASGVSGTN